MTRKRTDRTTIGLRQRASLEESIKNIFFNVRRFHWSHADVLAYLKGHIYATPQWKSLQMYNHEYLRGYIECEMTRIWRECVVFSYECVDGIRRVTGKYDMPSDKTNLSLIEDTGRYVWIEDNNRFWS
jgi:hypothetical protein